MTQTTPAPGSVMRRRRGLTEEAAETAVDQACRALRLPTVRARAGEMLIAAEKEQLTYRGFLADLLLAECDDRDRRRSARRVKAAGFPREKWLGDFDFDANLNVNAATIHTLSSCAWVRSGHPLCLIGDSGTGKSHLLIGLATAAAEAGFRVKYALATKLVNELVEATDEKVLAKTVARYGRVDLICIDELGYMALDRRGAELLFQVLTEREEKNFGGDRVQRVVLRLDENVPRPTVVRRHRRPAHLRRPHHRNRQPVLPPRAHPGPPHQLSRHAGQLFWAAGAAGIATRCAAVITGGEGRTRGRATSLTPPRLATLLEGHGRDHQRNNRISPRPPQQTVRQQPHQQHPGQVGAQQGLLRVRHRRR